MKNKTIYAVVDLEATGTSAAQGDRIIQFSCTFVQNQRVIDNFSTLINPLIPIPDRITRLTGITNQMVSSAPTFYDVAPLLSNMLKGTVFVAHNVNFDFPFMNAELRRLKLPALRIKAIDTVTMSQILLPTLPSYQLRRISGYFNIVHRHPHSASSDALATADLLILLIDRLHHLPYQTLKGILKIRPRLPQNTMEMFINAFKYRKRHYRRLPVNLHIKHGVVLRKLSTQRTHHRKPLAWRYPATKAEKCTLYHHQLRWDPQQAQMMNQIYRNFTRKQSKRLSCLFEVSTGMGRKIGYTLPLAYLSHNRHEVVIISTDSALLREQLQTQTIPTLNALLPFSVSSLVIRNSQNYLDLNHFVNTLKVRDKSNLSQLLKAKLLVWLTITRTGNLAELHLNSKIPYLREIRHYQNQINHRHNPFYCEDPIRHQSVRAKHANFVIVSHRYLYKYAQRLSHLSRHPYLVIDEATHLPQRVLENYRFNLNLNSANLIVRRILSDLHRTHGHNLRNILPNRIRIKKYLKKLDQQANELKRVYQRISHRFSITFLQPHLLQPVNHQLIHVITPKDIKDFFNSQNAGFQIINRNVHSINRIANCFRRLIQKRYYRRLNRLELDDFYYHVTLLNEIFAQFNALIHQANNNPENCAFEAVTNQPHNVTQCILRGGLVSLHNQLRKNLYRYFQAVVFTDHAFVSGQRYLSHQLEIPGRRFLWGADLSQKRVIINAYQSQKLLANADSYIVWLSHFLAKQEQKRPRRILVAFASIKLMKAVFDKMVIDERLNCPIYAEELNGSHNRILKRLVNARAAIIMVRYPWFNSLNLVHADLFDDLIIAELPFTMIDNLFNRMKLRQIMNRHHDPVLALGLPQVVLVLKKTINYLAHYHNHLTILDGRFLKSVYYHLIIKKLPNHVIINCRKI